MGKTISIYLDDKVIDFIDEQASSLRMNRSEFISFVFTQTAIVHPAINELMNEVFSVVEKYRLKADKELEIEKLV
jgi:Ribbon-helix-helix protein, copG family.